MYRVFFVTEERHNQEVEKRDEQLSTEEFPPHWNYGATCERAGIYNPEWETAPPPDGYTFQKY